MRHLIFNGDDIGLCSGVNRAIFDLHKRGVVTSASLLVDGEAAEEAVEEIKNNHSGLSLGLHLDFGEPPFRIDKLAESMHRQWKVFYRLAGKPPTHVNVHKYPDIACQLYRFLPERVPLRNTGSINYIDKFNGCKGEEGVGLANLIKLLKRIKKGVYEISCHPSYEPVEEMNGMEDCGSCRVLQVNTLLDKRVKMILQMRRIKLISFDDLFSRSQFRAHILDYFYLSR